MQTRSQGIFCALFATIIWSGNFIVSRAIAQEIPPLQLNFWRWALAFCCLFPFFLPHWHNDMPIIRKHIKYLSFMGIFGVGVLNPLVYKAGQTTESLNMALLVPTAPIMIMIFSRICYGEPITRRRLCGLVLVLAGVIAVVTRGSLENLLHIRFTSGDFWALGGALSFGLYSLLMRKRPQELSATGFNTATFGLGLLYSLPPVLLEAWLLPLPQINANVIGGIVYAGVGCSFIAFCLWTMAIDRIGAVLSGFVYYTLPLFAAIGSILILNEKLLPAHFWGGLLIISGILTATIPTRQHAHTVTPHKSSST